VLLGLRRVLTSRIRVKFENCEIGLQFPVFSGAELEYYSNVAYI